MEFLFCEHTDHLEVVARGEFDLAACKAAVDDVAGRCRNEGVNRVLNDCRDTPYQVAIASRFNLADYIAATLPHGVRVVFLASTAHINFTRTLQNTAINRGALLLSTDSLPAAREFLGLTP